VYQEAKPVEVDQTTLFLKQPGREGMSRRQLVCQCRQLSRRSYSSLLQNTQSFHPELDVHPKNFESFQHLDFASASSALSPNKLYLFNDPPIYQGHKGPEAHAFPDRGGATNVHASIAAVSPFRASESRDFYRFALVTHRVATMTSKGKLPSMYALVVAGNGKGLVGWGQAKHDMVQRAIDKAFVQAVKNFGVVERFEDRTVWGDLQGKFGATNLTMWSRPPGASIHKAVLTLFTSFVGFGLRTSHLVNQVARAAGIRDLSAKVRGSRNAMNTVKLAVGMLQNKSRPVGTFHSFDDNHSLTLFPSAFGDGFGHSGSRKDKIEGMRSATEVAFARGRRAALVSR
jgi:small subunit ribosomal protein S5